MPYLSGEGSDHPGIQHRLQPPAVVVLRARRSAPGRGSSVEAQLPPGRGQKGRGTTPRMRGAPPGAHDSTGGCLQGTCVTERVQKVRVCQLSKLPTCCIRLGRSAACRVHAAKVLVTSVGFVCEEAAALQGSCPGWNPLQGRCDKDLCTAVELLVVSRRTSGCRSSM